MKEKENINMPKELHIAKELRMKESESFHTCGCSHSSLYTSPNTYSGPSKEIVEKELGNLFLSVLERLEREGRLSEIIESLDLGGQKWNCKDNNYKRVKNLQ